MVEIDGWKEYSSIQRPGETYWVNKKAGITRWQPPEPIEINEETDVECTPTKDGNSPRNDERRRGDLFDHGIVHAAASN